MMNQKSAVTLVVTSFFPDYELGGEVILKSLLNSDIKKELRNELFTLFRERKVSYAKADANLDNDKYLADYVSGLLDNWVRKNKEFNNGLAYVTQNPGSRSGSQDDQVKSLRGLKKKYANDPVIVAELDEAIAERIAIIKPETAIEINVDALPDKFKHLVPTE